jgi:spermidine/putrescine ABC transporter ATP-binding subunit
MTTQGKMDSIISIRGVSRHFGAVKAVDDVSFDIARGEFFSLLGPSGCGKTTLLRILAGFETPTSGEVLIDGQPMANVPPHQRPTNMVFQSYAIFPHLNVAQNIAYGLRKRRLDPAETERIVSEALDLIKLAGYGARRPDQLSGGQRQRVALARALVCKPKVLLLDEPLGALDKKLREEMQIELRQIQRQVGVTFVFVTHDQEEALTLSDRIAVMDHGKVAQIDIAARIYETPNSRRVAEFIGNMNFLSGVVRESERGIALVDCGALGAIRIPIGDLSPGPGHQALIALRPERIRLSWERPGEAAHALAGTLSAVAYFGDRSHFFVDVEGADRPLAVAVQNARQEGVDRDVVGRRAWLSWDLEAALLLPAD